MHTTFLPHPLLLHLGPSPWLCFGESLKGWFPPFPLIIFGYLDQHFHFALLRHSALNSDFIGGGERVGRRIVDDGYILLRVMVMG